MAGIKYTLQKELFDADNERVLSVCNVTAYKKKKTSFLCIVSTAKPRSSVTLTQVKQYDKGVYKRKRVWQLDEVKSVDGNTDSTESYELDMQLDKLYKWFTPNIHERQNLITVLYKQINRHVKGTKAQFKNVPKSWLLDTSPEKVVPFAVKEKAEESEDSDAYEDFHALTEKEELDLNRLISECTYAISNAELFMEQLTSNLQHLDGANVQSVLASEKQVDALMEQIETAIQEAEKVEKRLDEYDEILCHTRESMEKMGEKNTMIDIANKNNIKLLQELDRLVTQWDLPLAHQAALTDTDLTGPVGLKAAIDAGRALQLALNNDINPSLRKLAAVENQQKRFDKWRAKFIHTISRHLNNMFIFQGNDLREAQLRASNDISLASHTSIHKELAAYGELMHMVKAMEPGTYGPLTKVYTTSMSKVYEREIRHFFEQARRLIGHSSRDEMNTSISTKFKTPVAGKQVSQPYGVLGINRDQWSAGLDRSERLKFDSILERVLAALEPVALSEQKFCIDFFHLDVLSPTGGTVVGSDKLDASQVGDGKDEKDASLSALTLPQKRITRQVHEDVRSMMVALFGSLEPELNNFILSFEKLDSFYSLYVLVRLSQHVMTARDAQSFLSMTYASALVQVKRSFDRFMHLQLQSIRDSKPSKRSKCGLLPYVENFEEFAQTAEDIFRNAERRNDLDKWYLQLVAAIFEQINIHATEHTKTPQQVVKKENFHRMHSILAQLKVAVLEPQKKESKARYTEALRAYVTNYFGRPLEKLNLFFEGVQTKVSQGVKETEISYQMAYSKQELRKVIAQYPAREVKKGLESLYKKVEKHLCEEENLLQVVWRAMQEEFIVQYNFLEDRIQRCYAGAMITLDFTIDDILKFFSEIARSH